MADTKTTGLAALSAAPAENDLVMLVDVSDTTMAASGTNVKQTIENLRLGIRRVISESGDFQIDPTVHTNGCLIVAAGYASSAGARVVTLPAIANQPAVGYSITVVVTSSLSNGIAVNKASGGNDLGATSGGRVDITYVGSNYWQITAANGAVAGHELNAD
jgi:hypothetical protein